MFSNIFKKITFLFQGGLITALTFGSMAMSVPVHAAVYNAPTNVAIDQSSISAGQVRITWVSAGGDGNNFILWKSEDGVNRMFEAFVSNTTLSYTFGGLEPNTRYWFHVASGDDIGVSSAVVNVGPVYTLANPPGTPGVSNITATGLSLQLKADGNGSNTEYAIQEQNASLYVQADGTVSGGATFQTRAQWGTSVAVKGLKSNTKYAFRVANRNGDGKIRISASVTPTTLSTIPTGVDASLDSSGDIVVEWQGDGSEYHIDTADMASSGWVKGTAYTFTAAVCGMKYPFFVKARNSEGVETAYAAKVEVTMPACQILQPPPQPQPQPVPQPQPQPAPQPAPQPTPAPAPAPGGNAGSGGTVKPPEQPKVADAKKTDTKTTAVVAPDSNQPTTNPTIASPSPVAETETLGENDSMSPWWWLLFVPALGLVGWGVQRMRKKQ
jgi:hypothetical protein